ncbi:fatty acyl-CoA reductase 1-like [Temnothorax nylanderi]|uniref:fatty acyl-CoA reductase 1-like n=1 Tax=Temnothorax nylanderi TaxID=102681 RepID=UPI003A85C029
MTTDPAKSIPAFYAGQSILLTGATGFLGKVFIEKVLRSCPDIREIFLLMRPKKGFTIKERLKEILNLPLYERLREERFSIFEKLIPISGNVSEKELGLSDADRQMLIERVTIIIHGAASVRFNDSLKHAILSNTRATRDICILAQSMKNLKALVYVSTAFTHVNNPFIEEKMYPPIADWRKMIDVAESLDEHTLNIFTAKCLDYAPNTYIFSKNLAESVIQDYSFSFPCAIVRPSMVYPSMEEPFPGWIDNIYGPIGLTIGGGKGIIRVAYGNKDVIEDIVPVDIVINAILVVSWKIGVTTFSAGSIFVSNCTSQKPMTYKSITLIGYEVADEVPLEGIVWIPSVTYIDNFTLFYLLTMLLHILPATLIDMILNFSGRRPILVRLQRNLYVANRAVGYFACNDWKFSNTNSLALTSSIPPDDRYMFSFDYSDFNIKEYLTNCTIGAKKFLLHEDMNRLDAARAHKKRVYLFVIMVRAIISIGVLWIIYKWICSLVYYKIA